MIFQGHPSWRAILGFYLKGILVAAIVGVLFKLFGSSSATVFLVILVIVVLIFGANRLPQLGRGVGSAIKNFKDGMKDGASPDDHKS